MEKKCGNCGHKNRLTSSYCVQCGKLLPGMYEKDVVRKDSYVEKEEFNKVISECNSKDAQIKTLKDENNRLRQNQHTAPVGSIIVSNEEYNGLLSDRKTLQSYKSNGYAPWGKRLITNSEYDRLNRSWYKKLDDGFENWMDKYWWTIILLFGLVAAFIYLVKSCGNDNHKNSHTIEVVKDEASGKYGIYNNESKTQMVAYEYDSISHRKGTNYQGDWNFFFIHKNGKFGVADSTGRITISCELDKARGLYNGIDILFKEEKQGLMNAYGQQIIPCEYQYVLWENEPKYSSLEHPGTYVGNILPVKADKNSGWELYNRSGRKIRGQHYKVAIQTGDPKLIKVRESRSDYKVLYGIVDESGQVVIPCNYYSISVFGNDRAWAKQNYSDSWALITSKGERLMTLSKGVTPSAFHDGMAAVTEKGKIGYCDTSGKFVIPMKYEQIRNSDGSYTSKDFYYGKARVSYNGKPGSIDKTGKFTPDSETK